MSGMLRRIAVSVAGLAVAGLVLGCAPLQGARAYRLGTEALERGQVALAVEQLERAAHLMPETSEVHNQLGVAHASDGDLALALGDFARASSLDCDNAAAAANLARAQADAKGELGVQSSKPAAGATP